MFSIMQSSINGDGRPPALSRSWFFFYDILCPPSTMAGQPAPPLLFFWLSLRTMNHFGGYR
jgi:hypothetical protein